MLRNWIIGLGLSGLLAGSASAATVIEADGFMCVSPSSEPSQGESMMMFASTYAAKSMRIARAAKVTPDGKATQWCENAPGGGMAGERRETEQTAHAAACRADGPALATGVLTLRVTETLMGAPAEEIEVRIRPAGRVAFVGAGAQGSKCDGSSVIERIGGKIHFSPSLFALDPTREFLVTENPMDEGATGIIAIALPANSAAFKRSLRKAVRERTREQAGELAPLQGETR